MAMVMDALDSAVLAAENRGMYWGQINVDGQFVVFQKNVGKLSYIEGQHDPKERRTEIEFVLSPIDEMGVSSLIQRSMIAESREWSDIVWPSLKKFVKRPHDIDGRFVKVQMVPNGRSWADKTTGEMKQGTTFKFLDVYQHEAACKAAFVAESGIASTVDDNPAMGIDMSPLETIKPKAPAAPTVDPERETAVLFLPALIKQAGGDVAKLESLIKAMPMVAKFFTIQSVEVQKLMAA